MEKPDAHGASCWYVVPCSLSAEMLLYFWPKQQAMAAPCYLLLLPRCCLFVVGSNPPAVKLLSYTPAFYLLLYGQLLPVEQDICTVQILALLFEFSMISWAVRTASAQTVIMHRLESSFDSLAVLKLGQAASSNFTGAIFRRGSTTGRSSQDDKLFKSREATHLLRAGCQRAMHIWQACMLP